MKLLPALTLAALVASAITHARDVHVDGYYRRDGTYVAPHVRSSPDSSRWNNYGPSSSGRGSSFGYGTLPSTRDSDRDGIANQYDLDDDNNGTGDDDE